MFIYTNVFFLGRGKYFALLWTCFCIFSFCLGQALSKDRCLLSYYMISFHNCLNSSKLGEFHWQTMRLDEIGTKTDKIQYDFVPICQSVSQNRTDEKLGEASSCSKLILKWFWFEQQLTKVIIILYWSCAKVLFG